MKYITRTRTMLPLLLLVLAVLATSALAADFEKEFTFNGDELKISNLIGKVDVRPTSGDQIRVSVFVRGDDARQGLIEFETDEGDKAELHIIFPIDDNKKYVYPELGGGSKTSISYHGDDQGGSWLKKVFGRNNITVRGKGSGLEVWADVVVEVPRGRKLEVKLGVGEIEAAEVQADLVLDTNSGAIYASKIEVTCWLIRAVARLSLSILMAMFMWIRAAEKWSLKTAAARRFTWTPEVAVLRAITWFAKNSPLIPAAAVFAPAK